MSLKTYIARLALKTLQTTDSNSLYRMMFQYINYDLPLWMGSNPKNFIDKGFAYNDLVYSIISTKMDIADSISWLTYKVVDDNAMKAMKYHHKAYSKGINPAHNLKQAHKYRQKALQEVSDKQVKDLVEHPNSHQSLSNIASEYFGWMDVIGNFYLYALQREDAKKSIQSVHVAPAHEVEIIAGNWYNPVKGYKLKAYLGNEEIAAEQMMHLKNWNPEFDYDGRQLYGFAPLKAGARILALDNVGIETSEANFKNSGVRGIIHQAIHKDGMANGMTPEQAAQLKNKIDSWSGHDKSGGIAATNAPIAFTKIGDTPVDLGIYQAMDKNMIRLCNLFKVPPELFMPGTTFSNKAEARKTLITTGILPKMDLFRDRYNRFVVDKLNAVTGKQYYVDYDLFSIAELQEDLGKIADMYKGIDWVTINEKREAMNYGKLDKDPSGLADELFADPFKMPLSQISYDTDYDTPDEQLKRLNSKAY
jgi:HK97 family phage portal protein